uniref:NADH dehydrogenase subunit 6 n=1 Tax=Acrobeloides nanus TaxID=290746 RepID=A0A914C7V6_9BILA
MYLYDDFVELIIIFAFFTMIMVVIILIGIFICRPTLFCVKKDSNEFNQRSILLKISHPLLEQGTQTEDVYRTTNAYKQARPSYKPPPKPTRSTTIDYTEKFQ